MKTIQEYCEDDNQAKLLDCECRIIWNRQGEPEDLVISFNPENREKLITLYAQRSIKKIMVRVEE